MQSDLRHCQFSSTSTYITGNSMCLDNLSSEVSKFYLFYATKFRTFSDVTSGLNNQITGEGLKKVSIPMPPLPNKRNASILTSVDEVIENTQKQIDKLQDLKKHHGRVIDQGHRSQTSRTVS